MARLGRDRGLGLDRLGLATRSQGGGVEIVLSEDGAQYGSGVYWTKNDTWGRDTLVNGVDYDSTITLNSATFPNQTVFDWSWPAGDVDLSVRSYMAVCYGTDNWVAGAPEISGMSPIAPARVDHIDTLTITYDVSHSGTAEGYMGLGESFLFDTAKGSEAFSHEIAIFYLGLWFEFQNTRRIDIDGFSGVAVLESGGGGAWDFIKIVPDTSATSGTFNIKAVLDYCKAQGWITGREYLRSWKQGVEVLGNDGTMTINGFSGTFSASEKLSLSGVPVWDATPGAAYDGFTVTAHDGVAPYVYSLFGTWPAGISIDSATGIVSGTVSGGAGDYTGLTVQVTDATDATATLPSFTLSVADTPVLSPSGTNLLGNTDPANVFVFRATAEGSYGDADGGTTATFIRETTATGEHGFVDDWSIGDVSAVSEFRFQGAFKPTGRNVRLYLADSAYAAGIFLSINLATGAVISQSATGGWGIDAVHVIAQSNGYYLIAVDGTKGAEAGMVYQINALNGSTLSYAGNTANGFGVQNLFLLDRAA